MRVLAIILGGIEWATVLATLIAAQPTSVAPPPAAPFVRYCHHEGFSNPCRETPHSQDL